MMIFIFALAPISPISSATPLPNFAIAKPNCENSCGNISIPFPFGSKLECSLSIHFWVICNHTSSPPRLFWQNTTIEFTDISLDGQLKLLKRIAYDCYRNGIRTSTNAPWISLAEYFTVNNTANMFTIVGCDSYGYVSGRILGRNFTTGCSALCEAEEDLREASGSCMGVGCCQTSIPKYVWMVDFYLRSFDNYSEVSEFNDCGYAFVAEVKAFSFSYQSFSSLKNGTKLPMVVDWAIGNTTCQAAEKNSATYACMYPNSTCYKPNNGYGYRCRCPKGYEGNPYLSEGCVDINECTVEELNECKYECVNTQGGFSCPCPKGYRGDGRKGGDGCTRKESFLLRLIAGIALGVIALLLVVILFYLELKRRSSRKKKQKFFQQNGGMLLLEKLSRRERSADTVRIFTSSELHNATNDFHNSMVVGRGGFGIVYKGFLESNSMVAIKKSKRVDPDQIEQFINEVFVLSQVNHRNVVRLLGCCLETEVPLLVYEFISNGTLSSHVHYEVKARFLHWETRMKIAAETAGVLSYLHSAASTPIIHRDVKSDNILLDHTFTAKVSDFGASRLVPVDQTQLSTTVQGTLGYLDPEYLQTHQLTEKSDVYSFGVVLVELLTGRKAISPDRPEEERNLVNFFISTLKKGRLLCILDHHIVNDENMNQILEVAMLAKGCLIVRGEDRPIKKEVAMELEGLTLGGKHSWARNEQNVEEMGVLAGRGGEKREFQCGR